MMAKSVGPTRIAFFGPVLFCPDPKNSTKTRMFGKLIVHGGQITQDHQLAVQILRDNGPDYRWEVATRAITFRVDDEIMENLEGCQTRAEGTFAETVKFIRKVRDIIADDKNRETKPVAV